MGREMETEMVIRFTEWIIGELIRIMVLGSLYNSGTRYFQQTSKR